MKLAEKKKLVLEHLCKIWDNWWVSPTEIGRDVFNRDSSYTSPVCKALVEDGLIERNYKGWYRVIR